MPIIKRTKAKAVAAPAPKPEPQLKAPKRLRIKSNPQPQQQQETALAPASSNVIALPPLDAPAVNTAEPAISYKIDFSSKNSWFASSDGGRTKEDTGTNIVAGIPVDFALQISKAKGRDGFDQRLRLAFYQHGLGDTPVMAEINCNAVNSNRDGALYVTSSGRSLAGALLAISDSEDDMEVFCQGARFRVRPGSGKGVFIEVDIAVNNRWVGMSSPANTNRIARDPAGLHAQLAQIKQRFRSCGLLLSAAAVIGQMEEYDEEMRGSFAEVPVISSANLN